MTKIQQTGQRRTLGRFVSRAAWGSLGLGMALLTGCTHTPPMTNAQPKPDPLLGVPPAPTFPNQAPAQGVQPQAFNTGGVPAIPALHSPTSNAMLASMSGPAPIGTLALNDDASRGLAPGQLMGNPGATKTPPLLPPNPNPKVEPVPDSVSPQGTTPTVSWQSTSNTPPVIAPPPPPYTPPQPTDETLAKALQDRGVINQKRDQTPDGLKLTCYVAAGPTTLNVLEVTAASYVIAAQEILQKLDAK